MVTNGIIHVFFHYVKGFSVVFCGDYDENKEKNNILWSKNSCGTKEIRAIPHNSARADFEKICVRKKALFRRHTLCMARKSNAFADQIFQKPPQTILCGVAPDFPIVLKRIAVRIGNTGHQAPTAGTPKECRMLKYDHFGKMSSS